jgi:hypothetical protein
MQLAKTVTIKHIGVMRKAAYIAALLVFFSLFCFSVFYLSSDYRKLVLWYCGLENCFYGVSHWSADFFTPGIKSDGNTYALVGAIVSAYWMVRMITGIAKRPEEERSVRIHIDVTGLISVAILTAAVVLQWTRGNASALPAFDEIFSATNCAGKNLFQCVSYYMLPNNHILFNLVNGAIFHFVHDKVVTGRVISLVMYEGVVLVAFYFFGKIFANRWLACFAGLLISTQFMTWGFGFQARGYEMYLFSQWGALLSIYCFLTTGERRWLSVNAVCTIVGYACIPSFLFYDVGQTLGVVLAGILYNDRRLAYIKQHLVCLLLVFLFYLPALCFSGLAAFANNNYVTATGHYASRVAFVQGMFPYFQGWVHSIFSGLVISGKDLSVWLYLLPAALLLMRRKELKLLGLFYVSIWVAFFAVTFCLKRLSFERNLIGQYSMTLAFVAVFFFYLLSVLPALPRGAWGRHLLFLSILVFMGINFVVTNDRRLQNDLYETNTNAAYKDVADNMKLFTQNSSVGLSDNGFYFQYIAAKIGVVTHQCPDGNEDYYLKMYFEPLPFKGYQYAGNCSLYQVYKKAR